jgi:outer membrane protein assembly factor BamB
MGLGQDKNVSISLTEDEVRRRTRTAAHSGSARPTSRSLRFRLASLPIRVLRAVCCAVHTPTQPAFWAHAFSSLVFLQRADGSIGCAAHADLRGVVIENSGVVIAKSIALRRINTPRPMTRESMLSGTDVEGDAAATVSAADDAKSVATNPDAERVEGVKARLATLFSHEAELDVELSELEAAVERVTAKRDAVRAEITAAKIEFEAAVNAPVSGGSDPTESLPDELIVMIMLMLPFASLWSGACKRVCRRWNQLMESAPIVRRKREGRWAAYEARAIKPHVLEGHTHAVCALAIGPDGKVYSGSQDRTIRVWSGESGAHLQTLQGHTNEVRALAIGLDGKIHSGSCDETIRVWSSASGTHLQTLVGHTHWVFALAVGLDGKVYSGSCDGTVRVWSGDDGTHLHTLVGHTSRVCALAVGKDGAIFSGSEDRTIRVWSGENGIHLRTLVGHSYAVSSVAVGLEGKVYSGSWDRTIRVWSPDDGALLQTLTGHDNFVTALAVGLDGKVFSGSHDQTIRVWNGETGALLHTLNVANVGGIAFSLALGRDGTLFSVDCNKRVLMWR